MIYFADRKFNILGSASTKMNNGYGLVEDKLTEEIETFTSNYDGVLSVDDNKISEVKAMLNVGNYILYVDDFGENRYYTITDSVSDRKEGSISFQSDAAGLDLLNEVYPPYVATEALTIEQYIEKFAYDSGFVLGLNEIPNLTRQLKWEGSDTGMKRMLSVANSFDKAELSFSFEVVGMLVVKKYINVHVKRGVQLEEELRLNRDIDNIITTESILDLKTAVEPVGGRPTDNANQELPPISLQGKVYDDGRYYIKGRTILDRESNAIWSRYLSPTENGADEGYIVGRFEYDTLSQDELFNRSLAYLKTVNAPAINYNVEVSKMPSSARVGDTINIVDDDDLLYLNGRILKKEYSSVKKEGTFTLGDYIIKESGINEQLQALADRIASIKSGSTFFPWVRYADDANGNGFSATPTNKKYMAILYAKDNPIPSDVPADYAGKWILIQGPQGATGPNGQPVYTWIKYADNVSGGGMSDSPVGKAYIGMAFNKPTSTESTNPTDYQWSLLKGDTGAQGPAGPDGKPSYFHTAWADSSTGTVGFSLTISLGKKYMGTYSDFVASNSTNPASYKWVELANSIEVGGVNLFNDTNPLSNFTTYQSSVLTYTQGVVVPDWKANDATNIKSTGGTHTMKAYKFIVLELSIKDQPYVFSGYIENKSTTAIALAFNDMAPTINIPANSKRFVVQKLIGNGVSSMQVRLSTGTAAENLDVNIWHWQYERGNVATDWSPIPAETTNKISDLANTVNSITYPVVSATQPVNPKEGQQWWRTDSTGKVTGYFVYRSALSPQWQPQVIQQSILNIESLNAVNITGSDIKGTTITGSTLGNTFNYMEGTLNYIGTSQFLNNTIQMNTEVYAAGVLNAKSKFLIDPMQVHGEILKADDTLASSYTLTGSGGLEMTTAGVGNIKYDLDGIKYQTATGGFGLDFLYTTNGLTIRPKGGLQNGAIEMEGMTPYIDFHSNGWTTDNYSSRIIASGGNGTNGNGTLTFHGWNHDFITPISATSNPGIRITSNTIGSIASNDLRVSPGTGGALEVADRNGAYRPVRASAFTVSSDRNIKKNITEMSSFNDVIKDLKIYKYNLNTEEDWELKHTGFIMQEVPVDFISPDYSIDLYSIAAINNGAIQENHREIASLKSEIESLKLQVETLMANHDK